MPICSQHRWGPWLELPGILVLLPGPSGPAGRAGPRSQVPGPAQTRVFCFLCSLPGSRA